MMSASSKDAEVKGWNRTDGDSLVAKRYIISYAKCLEAFLMRIYDNKEPLILLNQHIKRLGLTWRRGDDNVASERSLFDESLSMTLSCHWFRLLTSSMKM